MGSLNPAELSLDCRFYSKACVQRTTGKILADFGRTQSRSDKISKLDECVKNLQAEKKKIGGLKRELPYCMLFLGDAIVALEEELTRCRKRILEPVLEEFLPLKESSSEDKDNGRKDKVVSSKEKMSWMSSVQLWNSGNQHQYQNTDLRNKRSTSKLDNKKRTEEARNRLVMDNFFQSSKNRAIETVSFKGFTNFPVTTVAKQDRNELLVPGLSLCTPQINNSRENISGVVLSPKSTSSRSESSSLTNIQANFKTGQVQNARKQRRCWSQELHRRFVDALNKLGGAQVATPKQIRELMKVDGLTNDEVKSHLQKFRLHNRRIASKTSQNIGWWMPQELLGEPLKLKKSQGGSPTSPLDLSGSPPSGAESIEDEDTDSDC